MRTLAPCLAVLVALSLAAAAAAAADEPPAAAAAAPRVAPAVVETIPSALSGLGEANGSHFDLDLYLNIPELFQMLVKVGAIPQELAERALAASKAEAAPGDGSTSYVKIEAHIRITEVAPLLAVLSQAQPRRAPGPEAPAAARVEKPERRPAAPPAK